MKENENNLLNLYKSKSTKRCKSLLQLQV